MENVRFNCLVRCIIVLGVFSIALTACDGEESVDRRASVGTSVDVSDVSRAPTAAKNDTAPASTRPASAVPLDLSVPPTDIQYTDEAGGDSLDVQDPALPDLFLRERKERRTTLDGKLEFESPQHGNAIPEVSGATLDLEVKVK